ncbi:MAG: prenyltransferase/squalene oxidase repeat-containing protein, partial [Planctomycetaceae bacterium]
GQPLWDLDGEEFGRRVDSQAQAAEHALPEIFSPHTPVSARSSRRRHRAGRTRRQTFHATAMFTPPLGAPIRTGRPAERETQNHSPQNAHSRQRNSMLISTGLHVLVLLLLASMTVAVNSENAINTVLASFADETAVAPEHLPLEEPLDDAGLQQQEPVPEELPAEEPPPAPEEPVAAPPQAQAEEPVEPEEVAKDVLPGPGPDATEAAMAELAKAGSRSEAGKQLLLQKYGGSAESESAVQRALEWFAARQRSDGSWNFKDVGPCSHPGEIDNPMGATAYVLLCYLGAGQTHQSGRFKDHVRAGLTFLISNGQRVPAGGDFRGPDCREHDNFYVQAPAAMALSEAYQMTKDRRLGLRQAAQLAVDFLCHAQDPQGGGWRYEPREAGCTSVTALVALALQSAGHAGLTVPPRVQTGISHFLDTVRSEQALTGRYGYRAAEPDYRASTTAMALLCRMHLGWTKDNEELQQGIAVLDKRGPYDNLYYCYYATQVMRHWGGRRVGPLELGDA